MGGFCCCITRVVRAGKTSLALLFLKLFLTFVALLGASYCFTSSTMVIPLHAKMIHSVHVVMCSGIVSLPLKFFSRRHGKSVVTHVDKSINRMRGSVADSLSVLVGGPVLVLFCFDALVVAD